MRGTIALFEEADGSFRGYLAAALLQGDFDHDEARRRARVLAATLSATQGVWAEAMRDLRESLTRAQLENLQASAERRLALDPITGAMPLVSWVREVRGLSPEGALRLVTVLGGEPGSEIRRIDPFLPFRDAPFGPGSDADAARGRGFRLVLVVETAKTNLSPSDRQSLAAALTAR